MSRAALAAVLAAALVAACSSGNGATEATDERTPQAAPKATGPAAVRLGVESTPAGARLDVRVTAPTDATEMQVGTDPSFVTTPWTPVVADVKLAVDGGYQEVFARFRSATGTIDPVVVVGGVDVDLAAQAATAKVPTPTMIALADPTTLSVDVQVGRVVRGLGRAGDKMVGATVDPTRLDEGWRLTAGSTVAKIVTTSRSTTPTDTGHTAPDGDATLFPVTHRIRLTLATPLAIGTEYTLTSPLGTRTKFTINDLTSRSPAVHANQVGYRPGDVSKRAYLSAPTGKSGMPDAPTFRVVDVATGVTAFSGAAVEQKLGKNGELGHGDLTGERVWQLDFSVLTAPGRYRACVDGIGCSEAFSIDENGTWLRAATTVARGLFHQRSGIALGPPYTAVSRPRPDHPDDGLVVHQSQLTALEAADMPDDEVFRQLTATASSEEVDGAWGGAFDAGDWDRRAQHLWMVREVFDLLRVAPDRFATLSLNIPESGDAVPDIADEALWTLDLFKRMQRADGAVRGGIESAHYPGWGTPSWKDTLPRYAYAPDPWSSYLYASAAADASVALKAIDPERAKGYADSAIAAMVWAQSQEVPKKYAEKIRTQRAVAAASMLALTGDDQWNQLFIADTPFAAGPVDALGCNANELCDAGWNYLWVDRAHTDPAVVKNIEQSFTNAATRVADGSDSTLYGWCVEDPDVPLIWGLGVGGTPHAMTLLRAWLLTSDSRFLADAERCASVSLGANPLDVSYVTGLGATPARHPLIVDANAGRLPVWPGTPVYGNHPLGGEQQWVVDYRLKPAGTTGDLTKVPYMRSWYDIADVGPMDEFTVYQSHGPSLWVFGVLASAAPRTPK
ncbi:MAG: glycoside hydrolase family 9 protein [Acidimicrobiales bacterium]